MLKKLLSATIVTAALVGTYTSSAQAAGNSCITLGGTAQANMVDQTHLIAAMSGEFAGAAKAEILSQTTTDTGLSLELEHFFFNDRGGLLRTNDTAVLTAVTGRENVYMIEFTYEIVEASGAYEGYNGSFQSYGLFDLEKGQAVIRYNGEICK